MPTQEGGIQMNSARTGLQPASWRRGLLGEKVAIITGASRGIGASTARIFADAGATVVLAARDEQASAAVAKEIDAAGGQALVVPTDVVDASSVEHLVERTLAAYGRLDAAFNNAGGGYIPVPIADIAVEEFDRVVAGQSAGRLPEHEVPDPRDARVRWGIDRQHDLYGGAPGLARSGRLRRRQARGGGAHREWGARLR